jgi:hypothetical protein
LYSVISSATSSSTYAPIRFNPEFRRTFVVGSDARIIMGNDEADLIRLWRGKRGEVEREDLADNLIVQLGIVTEDLNRRWCERNTRQAVKDVQKRIQHPVNKWMAASLDGLVDPGGAVFEANSCCLGRSRRKPPPKDTWRSCSTTCGWPIRGPRRCPLSLGAASGPRSRCTPICYTSICC